MTKKGEISINIQSNSWLVSDVASVEIRDSQLRLVEREGSTRKFTLPKGLYEVSAVLEDGHRYKQLVIVQAGKKVNVDLIPSKVEHIQEGPLVEPEPEMPKYKRPRFTQAMNEIDNQGQQLLDTESPQLLEVKGASLLRESQFLWVFGTEQKPEAVPTAEIGYGGHKYCISLPISPEHVFPENSCVVKIDKTRTGPKINAWIAKERTEANALQNMLASGYPIDAANVASSAMELLESKYSDPTGAALGALILFKVGKLGDRVDWLRNLAHSFDWLPDGKVLYAKQLFNDEAHREEAIQLGIEASFQRMLYTECYSILLDFLRRWPEDDIISHYDKARWDAIEQLASRSTDLDWESICLTEVF
ncbi:hypothetical protein JR338_12375 [Chloroflexota bacterium]|nr:hypothetical protein JR338_12375 [Chloroflexota bacterium]